MPILALLYLLSFMDRCECIFKVCCRIISDSFTLANIGNARLNGLERDLNMSSAQYSLALSCFFIT